MAMALGVETSSLCGFVKSSSGVKAVNKGSAHHWCQRYLHRSPCDGLSGSSSTHGWSAFSGVKAGAFNSL